MGSFTKGLSITRQDEQVGACIDLQLKHAPLSLGPDDRLVAPRQIQAMMFRVTLYSDTIKWPCYYSVA